MEIFSLIFFLLFSVCLLGVAAVYVSFPAAVRDHWAQKKAHSFVAGYFSGSAYYRTTGRIVAIGIALLLASFLVLFSSANGIVSAVLAGLDIENPVDEFVGIEASGLSVVFYIAGWVSAFIVFVRFRSEVERNIAAADLRERGESSSGTFAKHSLAYRFIYRPDLLIAQSDGAENYQEMAELIRIRRNWWKVFLLALFCVLIGHAAWALSALI